MESLMLLCKEVMNQEFGFFPHQSTINFYGQKDWDALLSSLGITWADGFFLPSTLSAHVPLFHCKGILPYIIHEYFGHGSFYEFTPVGKKIVSLEKKLNKAEDSLAKKSLMPNKELKKCNMLRDGFNTFFLDHKWLIEGFAVWLESFLLQKLNRFELWEEREKSLFEYLDYYNHFKLFEEKTGPLSLVYKSGFPKNLEGNKIKQVFEENVKNAGNIEFLVHYGSMQPSSDIDLLAVVEGNRDEEVFYDGALDAVIMGREQFGKKAELFDLSIMDIIKTGKLVSGNKERYEKICAGIQRASPTSETVSYLRKASFEYYNFAQHFLNMGIFEENSSLIKKGDYRGVTDCHDFSNMKIMFAISNLCFALSYSLCAGFYSNGLDRALSFRDILGMDKALLLKKARRLLKNSPTRKAAESLIGEVENFITSPF